MPKFSISYAYDVPYYADFFVEAETPEAALAIAQKALDDGRFEPILGNECLENKSGDRVFLNPPHDDSDWLDPLEELVGHDPAWTPLSPAA